MDSVDAHRDHPGLVTRRRDSSREHVDGRGRGAGSTQGDGEVGRRFESDESMLERRSLGGDVQEARESVLDLTALEHDARELNLREKRVGDRARGPECLARLAEHALRRVELTSAAENLAEI